jgi:putative ATP-dependent endonuclease of OLD family
MRQAQLAEMLRSVADMGGQIFIVTHSPEVVRTFNPEDLVVLEEPISGTKPRHLATLLSPELKQRYESRLDRGIVRALFANVPVLVEGPSDRSVLEVFVRQLEREKRMRAAAPLGLDFVSCEGWAEQAPMAGFLAAAGKRPVALVERDVDALTVLREGGDCAAMLVYDVMRPNLEAELAYATKFDALVAGMTAVASDRTIGFDAQRAAVIAVAGHHPPKAALVAAQDLKEVFDTLLEGDARRVIYELLAHESGPFSVKTARSARLFAEALVENSSVPPGFAAALLRLSKWISLKAADRPEIALTPVADAPGS